MLAIPAGVQRDFAEWKVSVGNRLPGVLIAIASHLCEIGTADWFVSVRVEVTEGRATMIYENGSGSEHARQEIPYTDFPMHAISLYACWDGEHWVIMLPSEY